MVDLPEKTPELDRYIARRLAIQDGQDWSSLSQEERQAQVKKARAILAHVRRFLARQDEEPNDAEEH